MFDIRTGWGATQNLRFVTQPLEERFSSSQLAQERGFVNDDQAR